MDLNFPADSGNSKNQFFRTLWVASPIVPSRNDRGELSRVAPQPAIIAMRQAEATQCGAGMVQSYRHARCHDISGLPRHYVARKDSGGRMNCYGNLSSFVIASRAAAWRSGISATSADDGLLHTAGVRNDSGYVIARQQGAVLITGLIFLVILTLLGTTALQSTLLEEKMAGNLRDETLAFQAAEAALRSGEAFLEQVTIPVFDGSDGLYHHASSPAPDPINWSEWEADGRAADTFIDGVASQPRYFIEQLVSVPLMGMGGSAQQSGSSLNANMFRIVARGVGGTQAAIVLLQSTYRR